MPGVLGDAGQQPPQRRDPLGADREGDVRSWAARASCPAKYPASARIATRPEARAAAGRAGQRAAQQIRRGRARVIGAVAQVSGQHDLGLGPGRDVRQADPLALVVIRHAALLAAVDLHVGGVQVDRDRPASQRRRPLRGQQRQHPPGHRRQAGLHRLATGPGVTRRARPGRGRGRQARHRRDLLARRIGALAVQPGQEILPGQLRRRDPGTAAPRPRTRDPAA